MKSGAKADKSTREADLSAAVERCRGNEALMEGLHRIYEDVDRAVADSGAVCMGGGNCCKFDLFDHRLYLTVAELALLMSQPPPDPDRAYRMRCPYQVGPRCAAYRRRPLGCRTFFCRNEKKEGLERLHEHYHRKIQTLHETLCVPYSYAELTSFFTQSALFFGTAG